MAASLSTVFAGLLRGAGGVRLAQGWRRGIFYSHALRCEAAEGEEGEGAAKAEIDPAKMRDKIIPVETSIKYMQSEAYQTTYGSDPVWKKYRRNFRGAFPPTKTRKTCIRKEVISTGNPCPICRDEFLVLDPINTGLLKQFISPHNNGILPTKITNLCQRRHKQLEVAVHKARDIGLLTFDVPFRRYHYPDYYPPFMAADTTTTSTPASSTASDASASTPASPPPSTLASP